MKRMHLLAMITYLSTAFADPTPPTWVCPQVLTRHLIAPVTSHPESGNPNAYIDNNNVAYTVWSESKGPLVKAKLSTFEDNWNLPVTISDFLIGGQGPVAALNQSGQGYFPLVQYANSPQQVFARGTGAQFGDLTQVSDTQTFALNAAADGAGNAMIAWVNENEKTVQVAQFSNEQVVQSTVLGDFSPTPYIKQIDISTNFYGETVLVWNQKNRNFVASYFNGAEWSESPLLLDSNGAQSFSTGIDIHGRAHIVWVGTNCFPHGPVSAASFQFNEPVSQFGNLSSSNSNANPAISVCDQGRAVAVWTNIASSAIEAAYFDGQAWYPSTALQSLSPDRAVNSIPAVAVDSDGNAVITWNREIEGQATVIESIRFESFNQTWSAVSLVDTLNVDPNIQTFTNLDLKSNEKGSCVALYGRYGVPAAVALLNATILLAPEPTSEVFGSYIYEDGLSVKVITWLPSTTPNVVSYQVVRDGYLVATVAATDPLQFLDPGREKILDTYDIRAITVDGTFSVFNFVRL